MEENTELEPQSLVLDNNVMGNITIASKWAKFLAIAGFVFCGICVLAGIFMATRSDFSASMQNQGFSNKTYLYRRPGLGGITGIMYIFFAVIQFFPALFLFRFSNNLREAVYLNDQYLLNQSFKNLKKYFQFIGICILIGIILYLFLFGIILMVKAFR